MSRPNIIFILSDQHNVLEVADTPNIDRIAGSGIRFTSTYCSSPLCVPSRSGLLTGRLPSHNGVWNNVQSLRTDEVTVAHCLGMNGYHTTLCGRMHFNFDDQTHGFDEHTVGEITPTFPRPARQKMVYGPLAGSPDQSHVSIEKSGAGHSSVHEYDADVAVNACNIIRENGRDDQPFFLTVGFYGPHCPFVADQDLYSKYYERLEDIKAFRGYETLHPEYQRFIDLRGIRDLSDEDVRRTSAAYYANVEYMDYLIGDILDTAEKYLDMDNTIVVYSSDHGESLGHHGLYWKSNFYRESVNVPLVMSWKNHFPVKKIDTPVSLLDLAPTFLEITDSPALPGCDGKSLCRLIDGEDDERVIFSLLEDLKGDKPSAMVVNGRYKLIKFCGVDLPILIDMVTDPEENVNLALDERYSSICNELLDRLHEVWDESNRMEHLETARTEAALVKRFIKEKNPTVHGEWDGDFSRNSLL